MKRTGLQLANEVISFSIRHRRRQGPVAECFWWGLCPDVSTVNFRLKSPSATLPSVHCARAPKLWPGRTARFPVLACPLGPSLFLCAKIC